MSVHDEDGSAMSDDDPPGAIVQEFERALEDEARRLETALLALLEQLKKRDDDGTEVRQ